MKNLKKGFTLIELLVVIAIITILATIVMSQLTFARVKAANVAIKANLANLRTQAGLIFASTSSYNNVCADPIFIQGLTQVGTIGAEPAVCYDSFDNWVIKATMQPENGTPTNWCVDYTGKSEGITLAQYNAITSATTTCP